MDFTKKTFKPNPYGTANSISKALFLWLIPMFREGYKRDLNLEDMYDTLKDDVSKTLGDKLERQWNKQLELKRAKGSDPSLFKALWGVLGLKYSLLLLGFAFSELIFRVAQPLVLRELLLSFEEGSRVSMTAKYMLAAAVSLVTFGISLTFHPSCFYAFVLSMRCRIACSSLIYRKTLRLSKSAQGKTTVGQITNILSNDVNRFDYNLLFTFFIPLGILQMALFTVFLWREFGVASLTGLGIILLLIPIQYWNGRYSAKCRQQIAQRTDERGRIMQEIIIAMRIIKQYTWEKPFSEVIHKLREFEVEALRRRLHLRGFYLSMYMSTLKLVVFLTVLTYVLQGHKPTADKVFFLASVYFTMIQSVIYMIPSAISGIGEIFVCLHRMENFLMLEEKDDASGENLTVANLPHEKLDQTPTSLTPSKKALPTIISSDDEKRMKRVQFKATVQMTSLTATWIGEKMNLKDINLDVAGDKVVIVVGPVGSGKTSLLHILLGELPISSGKCYVQGQVSYAAQESWVFGGDVRHNILFGREFVQEKYEQVTKTAALLDDFKQLEFGDQTIVGERGASLSGGQKARINLARALYQDADIYLLDDPLSAVDTKVSRHLFDKCIMEHLKGKLRILVTHQLQYLPQADHIVVLTNGSIVAQGTFGELTKAGVNFVNLIEGDLEEVSLLTTPSTREKPEEIASHHQESTVDLLKLQLRKEMQAEKKATGSMSAGISWEYLQSAESPVYFIVIVLVFLLCQVSLSGSDYWLSYWTDAEAKYMKGDEKDYLGRNTYVAVFSGLVGGVILFNFLRAVGFFSYCMKISINVHDKMFASLIRAPARFFDDNPSGRIMNRFSKDLSSMDELLPPAYFDVLLIFCNVAGVFILIIISNYYSAIPTVVILVLLGILQRYYVCTARDVKRIEGVSKSPMFNHSSATFHGLTTIRSANAEPILVSQFDNLQDIHTASWFVFFSTARCFGIWVEAISVSFLAVVTFSFLLLQSDSNSGNVGLAITSALSIAGWLQFGMRQSAEVENLMTSVERNLEYAKLTPEAALESEPDKKPPADWPSSGGMVFSHMYLAYEEKDVLKDLTFEIKAKWKIGVVGRTGAGKSSIIAALFRLTEFRGDIYIDNVNIREIGLHDLRRNIAIIPQDPVLFSGTMRYNLDPFNQFEDEDLWKAIEAVELKDAVPALDYKVADGGSNFSLGQRQLVCLARAILRNNKIIVMDEATANVDVQTDQLIQTTIRSKFVDCSIITVAHRLHSVIDCDRILVLDNGTLKEYDHPHKLLQDKNGALTAMVQHTGKSSSEMLRKIAAETYLKRRASFQAESVKELSRINSLRSIDK